MTRASIIRTAVDEVPNLGLATSDGSTTLQASGGDKVSLLDAGSSFQPRGASTALFRNWYLYRPAAAADADKVRLIREHDPLSGAFRHAGPDYTNNPAAAERYLVLKNHPDDWNRAVNRALTTMLFFPKFTNFSPVSDTRRLYQVAAAPISVTVTRLSQIWGVQFHDENDTANEERWRDWADGRRTTEFFEDNNTFYLDFGSSVVPDTTMQMRLVTLEAYAALTDETTASNVEDEWASQAVLLVMADRMDRDEDWQRVRARMLERYWNRRRAVLGRFTRREVGRSQQSVGGYRVAGRAGR